MRSFRQIALNALGPQAVNCICKHRPTSGRPSVGCAGVPALAIKTRQSSGELRRPACPRDARAHERPEAHCPRPRGSAGALLPSAGRRRFGSEDMAYLKNEMRFAALANRFDWEWASAGRRTTIERRRSGLRFERVNERAGAGHRPQAEGRRPLAACRHVRAGRAAVGHADAALCRRRRDPAAGRMHRGGAARPRRGLEHAASSPSTRATILNDLRETAANAGDVMPKRLQTSDPGFEQAFAAFLAEKREVSADVDAAVREDHCRREGARRCGAHRAVAQVRPCRSRQSRHARHARTKSCRVRQPA